MKLTKETIQTIPYTRIAVFVNETLSAVYYLKVGESPIGYLNKYLEFSNVEVFHASAIKMPSEEASQGFLTTKNRFVNAKEATTIALNAGQINRIAFGMKPEPLKPEHLL